MSNLSIKEMENLLLASTQEDVLKKMTPKSQNVEYLRLMQTIKSGNLPWKELEKEMKSFEANKKFGYQLKNKIKVLRIIKSVENAADETERKTALNALNKEYLNYEFNYPKPATLETGNLGVDIQSGNEEQTLEEDKQLNESQRFLEEFEKTPNLANLQKLNRREAVLKLDFAKLGEVSKMCQNFLREIMNTVRQLSWRMSNLTNFKKFFDQLMNLPEDKMSFISGYQDCLFKNVPLEWLENLMKEEKWKNSDQLFHQIIQKTVNKNLDQSEKLDIDSLEEIKEFLMSKAPPKFKATVVMINLRILQVMANEGEFEKELFVEYLDQVPPNVIFNDSLRYDETMRNNAKKEKENSGGLEIIKPREHGAMVERYLKHFFKTSKDIGSWEKYFSKKYLMKLFMEVKLFQGERPAGFENVFTECQIKEMTERKQFNLLKTNKKDFELDEIVKLDVRMKNVNEVRVKVFQVNVEQALLENSHVDFSKMDLLGLVAKEEYVYRYQKEPLESWVETFQFESIQKERRGVFIIDFLAERMSSRAVITKGNLVLLSELKKLGTMCVILDEQRRICMGDHTGLYINKKFYKADEQGVIYLPNNDNSLNGEVIVCHENFATISTVEVRDPDLRLSFDVLFNREQLRVGNNVDLILFPMLSLFSQPFNLKNLKNVDVKIDLVSEEGNTKTFEFNEENNNSIELKEGSFSKVSVTFPPKTTRMSVRMSGEVALHKKDKRNLSDSKVFNFLGPSQKKMEQVYLNYDSEKGYVVRSKGRNGECVPHQQFQLRLTNPQLSRSRQNINLKTGSNGERVLGKLKHSNGLSLWISGRNDTNKSKEKETTYFYSNRVLLVEGDGVCVPVECEKNCLVMKSQESENIETNSGRILENITNNKENVEIVNGMLTLKNLEVGHYFVAVGSNYGQEIEIKVVEGKRFEIQGRRFIDLKDSIVQLPKETHFWRLEEHPEKGVRIVQGNVIVNGKPQEKPKSVEAVVFCHNFICEDAHKLTYVNRSNNTLFSKNYKLAKNENKYFNNKKIDEEILYVLRRRNQKEFMGNTLEKPTLLLKRQKVKDTSQENEMLAKEREFDADMRASRMCAKRMANDMLRSQKLQNFLDLSTDFLTNPGIVVTNGLSLDSENYLKVPEDQTKDFNHMYAVFNLGGQVILNKTLRSNAAEPQKHSLVLKESKKEGFVYRNIRKMNNVKGGDSHDITNIDKTEYRLVKSLPDLAALIPSLNPGVWGKLKEWNFLSTWSKLSPVEKLKKYDEFISHEMNIFLKFKDAQFFEEVVVPHIQNKREKTLVDHFLLGNVEEMKKNLSYGRFNGISFMEKILILMTCREDERAKKLNDGIALEMTLSYNKKSEEDFKRVFDKIIESTEKEEAPKVIPVSNRNDLQSVGFARNFVSQAMPTNAMYRGGEEVMMNYAAPPPMYNAMPQSFSNRIQPMQLQRASYGMQNEELRMEVQNEMMYDDLAYEEEEQPEYIIDAGFEDAGAQVYQGLESTTEYVEKKFYFTNSSITYNNFYSTLVQHYISNGTNSGFVDPEFIYCVNSPTEIVLLFAFLDLPFENKKPAQSLNQFTLTLTPENNCVVFSKQISEVKGEALDLDFLISQRFYDPSDRYYYLDDGTKAEKPVREYKKGKIYGSRVVVTNSTVSGQKVSVITEIPQGALPVNRADTLVALPKVIDSFCSEIIEFQFYFPHDGEFSIYPSTVAKGDKILATAKSGVVFEVGKKVPNTTLESITDILSGGNINDILNFLKTKNILNDEIFNFDTIGWLLSNEKVWRDVLAVYRERGIFDPGLWAFGFKFNDLETCKELMDTTFYCNEFKYLKTSLVCKDEWETKDYFPLVNPRAHSVNNQKTNILNKNFKQTYTNMLEYLIEKRFFVDLTLDDKILWITYLLLQDRIEEASQMFNSISAELKVTNPVTLIQKDYIEAYLDFMTGYPDFKRSKEICQQYLSYPVLTWRNLFVEIANQLAEYENEDFEDDKEETEKKSKTRAQQADESPFVKAEIVDDNVKISFKNQKRMHLEYYQIDLEVLFSQDPFEDKLNSSLTKVLPFLTETHKLTYSPDFQSQSIPIPTNLQTQNLLIRVVDDSKQSEMLKYVPFKLNSSLNERYGILKLTDPKTGKPIPKVYVKCFCKNSSNVVKFYKDGYTDLRGSFDFAAVSSNNADDAQSFKILVTSREFGSKVFNSKPPKSSVKKVGTAKKIRSSNWRSINKTKASKNLYAQTAAMF